MGSLNTLYASDLAKEVKINNNFDLVKGAAEFTLAKSAGLNVTIAGGSYYNFFNNSVQQISDTNLTLTASSSTNYIFIDTATNTITLNTKFFNNCIPLYLISTSATSVTTANSYKAPLLAPYNTNIFSGKMGGIKEGSGYFTFADLIPTNTSTYNQFKIIGGQYLAQAGEIKTITTATLSTTANASNYFYINTSNAFAVSTTEPTDGILLYKVVLDGSYNITSIYDYRTSYNLRQKNKYYTSTTATIALNTAYTYTHGLFLGTLSDKPVDYKVMLKCKTANNGFAVGDEVEFMTGTSNTTLSKGTYLSTSSTILNVALGSVVYVNSITGTIGDLLLIDVANWSLIVRVYTL